MNVKGLGIKSVSLLILAAVCGTMGFTAESPSPRVVKELATGWKFFKGDMSGAEKVTFDDTLWRSVAVPHDWSIEGPYSREWASGTGFLPGGVGWYRHTFRLEAGERPKSVFVEFDGVYCNSEVWINGHFLGKRPNGYISFQYDLTPHVRFGGEDNTLAVRVDHTDFADSRWYTGSGMYRPARLCIMETVRIGPWGVFVTAPKATSDAAEIRIETTIDNLALSPREVELTSYILDAAGLAVAKVTTSGGVIDAEGRKTYVQTAAVKNPRLWSVETPVLYSVLSVVESEGRKVDQVRTPFGVRTFRFDADKGFSLNGKSMKLKGVCVHHDAGPVGAAVPAGMWERRLKQLKEIGCNAIRMSHNPPAAELLDLCDRMGFVVMDEAFDEFTPPKNKWVTGWNQGEPSKKGYGEVFEEWAVRDIQDMVRRDRNHPSIIFWSIGNEIDYPNDPFSHEALGGEYKPANPPAEALVRYGKPLVEAVKAMDSTRPVTAALASAAMSNAVGFADILDVVGYNYQERRYADDHAKYPTRVLYGSENSRDYNAWKAVLENDFIAGQFLWVGYDFLGEARGWPVRNSQSGLFDLCGYKKPNGWFRQALWSETPMVFLTVRRLGGADRSFDRGARSHWNWTDGQTYGVTAFSNCPETELFLNGRSLGAGMAQPNLGPVFTWEVPYQPGELKVVGKKDGTAVCEFVLATAGQANKIVLKADTLTLHPDGNDVAHIEFYVADPNGVTVPDGDRLVRLYVSGPARLLAVGNGDPANHENETDAEHNAWQGQGLAVVQAMREPGVVTVSASSPGLGGMDITINVK